MASRRSAIAAQCQPNVVNLTFDQPSPLQLHDDIAGPRGAQLTHVHCAVDDVEVPVIVDDHLIAGIPDVATTLLGLARVYHALGQLSDAEAVYQRVIRIREENLGPDDVLVAEALEGYADVLRRTNREGQAETLAARAREIRPEDYIPTPVP